jgi:hypothetical protein
VSDTPTLPLTVTDVSYAGAQLYRVTVALNDGTQTHYLIPSSLATVEAVTISALAMGQLLDPNRPYANVHHRGHTRYDPRP